jgi:hypothetical protein
MPLTVGKAKVLMEKIAANQSWTTCNIQSCHKSEEVLKEVCVLSSKMDVLMNWLEQRDSYKKDSQAKMHSMLRINVENIYELSLLSHKKILTNNSAPQQ